MFKKIKRWYYKRKVIQTIQILKDLDKIMIKAGYDRSTRRRFWRDMTKDRKEILVVLDDVVNTLGPSRAGSPSRVGRGAGSN